MKQFSVARFFDNWQALFVRASACFLTGQAEAQTNNGIRRTSQR